MKVAVVDLVRVLDESKDGIAGAKRLEVLFEAQQRELAPLLQQLKAKRDQKIEKQAEALARDHEQAREKMRVDLRNALLKKAEAAVAKIAGAHGVDFVLGRPRAMLWSKPELNLTDALMTALDAP